ncbi:hypothetical protein [Mycolicibacterium sphagni]|uniref:Uncharacterized protein n=1 Tax=Mycolicibacterium sphagni TaxID=1786 RepID=A0A255DCL5_9MYCO|nr:hypothetical protein [Mycolicibacterium sphagni]OYN76850.1 hypothetical protein CG716_20265 [Mycolicibacterium sphagni]
MTTNDWKRVADKVIARRVELGMLTTTALAKRANLTPRALGDVENARRTNYTQGTKAQIEYALDWVYGSIDDILAGHEPTPADPSDTTTTPVDPIGDQINQQSLHDLITTYGAIRAQPAAERMDAMLKALRRSIHAVRTILLKDDERTVRANAIDALNPADAAVTFLQQDLEELEGGRRAGSPVSTQGDDVVTDRDFDAALAASLTDSPHHEQDSPELFRRPGAAGDDG